MFPDNNELLLSAGHGYQLRNEAILGKVLLSALICFRSQIRYSAKQRIKLFSHNRQFPIVLCLFYPFPPLFSNLVTAQAQNC